MLTLFLLIGTAFIVSSNQYRRANKSYSKFDEQENLRASQEGLLGEVLSQLIRDTNNQNSALRFHSLLRDMYGTEGFIAPNSANANTIARTDGQRELRLRGREHRRPRQRHGWPVHRVHARRQLSRPVGQLLEHERLPTTTNYKPYSQFDNYYNGLLVTFLNGPAAGHTTRIVGSYRQQLGTEPAPTDPTVIRILNFPAENGQSITTPAFLTQLNGSRILINGRPFNGTGVGYDSQATAARAGSSLRVVPRTAVHITVATPIALMPNAAFFDPDAVTRQS